MQASVAMIKMLAAACLQSACNAASVCTDTEQSSHLPGASELHDPRVDYFLKPRLEYLGPSAGDAPWGGRAVEYKISANELWVRDPRNESDGDHAQFVLLVRRLLSERHVPDVHFWFHPADNPFFDLRDLREYRQKHLPVLSFVTTANHLEIPIPYGKDHQSAARPLLRRRRPFKQKQPAVFFRGALSCWRGKTYDDSYSATLMRQAFERRARGHAWNDIRITSVDTKFIELDAEAVGDRVNATALQEEYASAQQYTETSFLKYPRYRYLLALDGATFTGRLPELFRHDSVVIKNRSPFEDVVTPVLLPAQNVIMVEPDGSDFEEQVEWLLAHDEEAQHIGEAGTALWERYFRADPMFDYMALLFRRLHEFYTPGLAGFELLASGNTP